MTFPLATAVKSIWYTTGCLAVLGIIWPLPLEGESANDREDAMVMNRAMMFGS